MSEDQTHQFVCPWLFIENQLGHNLPKVGRIYPEPRLLKYDSSHLKPNCVWAFETPRLAGKQPGIIPIHKARPE